MIKAVLFDFNGTLYNDSRLHVGAWQRFMKRKFNMEMSPEEIHVKFIGPSNRYIFSHFFGFDNLTDEQVYALSEEKEADYRAVARSSAENLKLVDGVEEMLNWLTEKHIPIALATSSVRDNVRFYLDDLGMKKWFSWERIVYEEGQLPTKPDPAYYIEAARRLGVDIADCAIVEDSPSGLEAAKRAHCGRIIMIANTMPADMLENDPAVDTVVRDFTGYEALFGVNA